MKTSEVKKLIKDKITLYERLAEDDPWFRDSLDERAKLYFCRNQFMMLLSEIETFEKHDRWASEGPEDLSGYLGTFDIDDAVTTEIEPT